jgi:hypothetical protein
VRIGFFNQGEGGARRTHRLDGTPCTRRLQTRLNLPRLGKVHLLFERDGGSAEDPPKLVGRLIEQLGEGADGLIGVVAVHNLAREHDPVKLLPHKPSMASMFSTHGKRKCRPVARM